MGIEYAAVVVKEEEEGGEEEERPCSGFGSSSSILPFRSILNG
jgi:hypothetical protein